jgi:hypothetical protein
MIGSIATDGRPMRPKIRISRPRWALAVSLFAGVFGLVTIVAAAGVLFIDGAWRQMMGGYVGFVVGFNFLAGFAYVAAAVGLALWRPWAGPLALGIAAATAVVALAFAVHVGMGGAFEWRTVGALAFRTLFWLGVAFAVGAAGRGKGALGGAR